MPAKCEKCETEVIWLWHKTTKKPAPIEFKSSPTGNVFIQNMAYRIATPEEIEKAKKIGKPLFLNHFATCEFAAEFRPEKVPKVKTEPAPAVVPNCSDCGLEMNLIENGTLWFCPFGCSKIAVK